MTALPEMLIAATLASPLAGLKWVNPPHSPERKLAVLAPEKEGLEGSAEISNVPLRFVVATELALLAVVGVEATATAIGGDHEKPPPEKKSCIPP